MHKKCESELNLYSSGMSLYSEYSSGFQLATLRFATKVRIATLIRACIVLKFASAPGKFNFLLHQRSHNRGTVN